MHNSYFNLLCVSFCVYFPIFFSTKYDDFEMFTVLNNNCKSFAFNETKCMTSLNDELLFNTLMRF